MTAWSIRRATAADGTAILQCLHTAFGPYRHHYSAEGFADTVLSAETIHDRLATMTVLVAVTAAGEIVGTIGWARIGKDEGHIRGMAILPQWQGSGIAAALLAAVEGDLRQRGCHRATLDTTQPLERAIRFYEKNGYRPSGKVGDFFGMPLFEYVKLL